MRLLNTTTYKLEDFYSSPPPYAILSHRWEEHEVTFADLAGPILENERETWEPKDTRKAISWKKIKGACKIAREQDCAIKWIWLDMCCINKESSAELQESLNSMFAWYRDAGICLVYLRDVPDCELWDASKDDSAFQESEWFARGWTLQELIAPGNSMLFFSRDWKPIGTRGDLASLISDITNIDVTLLSGNHTNPVPSGDSSVATSDTNRRRVDFSRWSIATRMSWAAKRKTTREEDRAYSLAGLFDVSLTVMYGEGGENAFWRLQLEIIQKSPDQSIFAWGSRLRLRPAPSTSPWTPSEPLCVYRFEDYDDKRNFLASRPSDFIDSADIRMSSVDSLWELLGLEVPTERHFYRTNHGIRIALPLLPTATPGVFIAALACQEYSWGPLCIAMTLKKVDGSNHTYVRCGKAEFSLEQPRIIHVGGTRDPDICPQWEASTIYIQWQPVPQGPPLYPSEFLLIDAITVTSVCGLTQLSTHLRR